MKVNLFKMTNELITIKENELIYRFLLIVRELKVSSRGFIHFPLLFRRVCGSLWVTKQECWKLMFEARDKGFIEKDL